MKNLPPVTVIATVGPSLFSQDILKKINRLGRVVFRINGAHGSLAQLEELSARIRKASAGAKIMLDLSGRKIRVTNLAAGIMLKKGIEISLTREQIVPSIVFETLKKGRNIIASDGRISLEIVNKKKNMIRLVPDNDGFLGNNKGIHIGESLEELPLFADRDKILLQHLNRWRINYVGLSFVCNAVDVERAERELKKIKSQVEIWPKIETGPALNNMTEILSLKDTFILDRGDLASEIGIENLPPAQEKILENVIIHRKQIVIATQLLKSMEVNPIPTIAELTEIYRLLSRGVFGLQMSEETAVGKYPLECVKLIFNMSERLKEKR